MGSHKNKKPKKSPAFHAKKAASQAKSDYEEDNPIAIPVGEQAPVGQWVGVQKGQVVAPDTWVDADGYLRSSGDDSYVAWHWGPRHCTRVGLGPSDMVYDPETGARWCDECWPVRQAFYAEQIKRAELLTDSEKIEELFRKAGDGGVGKRDM